jgi:hypothetical protein
MQQCNLMCLPENYQMKYYVYHGSYLSHFLLRLLFSRVFVCYFITAKHILFY